MFELPVIARLLSLLIEESPREQVFVGAFLLIGGLLILPFMLSYLIQLAQWVHSGWSHHGWWKIAWRATLGLMPIACGWIALLGAAKLSVYGLVRAGIMHDPWQS